jgi:hypothetical protein
MTDEEMADKYAHSHIYYEVAKREDGTEYAKEVSDVTIEQAFLAGLEAGRPKWHKVADGDLPKNSDDEKLYLVYWGENDYGVAQFNNSRWWSFDSGWFDAEEVIAWCEIPQYEEE